MSSAANPSVIEALGHAEGISLILRILGRCALSEETARVALTTIGCLLEQNIDALARRLEIPLGQRAPHAYRFIDDFATEAMRPAVTDEEQLETLDNILSQIHEALRQDVIREQSLTAEDPIG